MELTLQRTRYDAVSTEGSLYGDSSVFICYTFELAFTDGGVGSAILASRYPIILASSPKFEASDDPWVKKYAAAMPHILVPNRVAIMFHWGNDSRDTEGCVLVGSSEGVDFIGSSRSAFDSFYGLIRGAALERSLYVTVRS